jgi:hypothetical protein
MLPKYAELTTVNRNAPCEEYPGVYYIYREGREIHCFSAECGEASARNFLRRVIGAYADPHEFSLCWSCNDLDPRQGQVWFSGYYTLFT